MEITDNKAYNFLQKKKKEYQIVQLNDHEIASIMEEYKSEVEKLKPNVSKSVINFLWEQYKIKTITRKQYKAMSEDAKLIINYLLLTSK